MRKTRKSTLTKDERKKGKQSDALKIIHRIIVIRNAGNAPRFLNVLAQQSRKFDR